MKRFAGIGPMLLLPCLLLLSLGVVETRGDDTQKVVMDKAVVESMMRIIAQTASNLENVNDIVSSAACAPLVFESGKNPESGDSAGSLSRESLDRLRLCLASLQVALAEGELEEEQRLPSNRKCLDVTGDYRCPSGFEAYINFAKGIDGNFVYEVEYDDGSYYQYRVDDKKHNGEAEGKYIASCRRKFVKIASPIEGRNRYKVEEYTLRHSRDLVVDIYTVEAPGGNLNNAKRLKNKKFFVCEKL